MIREYKTSERDRLVHKAHLLVKNAIKDGYLLKADQCKCVDCSDQAYCYDHRDYRKPLDVVPVCRSCNNIRGPGLPLPTKDDGYRSTFAGQSVGHKWSIIDSDEPYMPTMARLFIELHDWMLPPEVISNHCESRMTFDNTKHFYTNYQQRYDWFKQRDPWYF